MQLLLPADINPTVRIANDHSVMPGQSWHHRTIPDLQLILIIEGKFEYSEGEQIWPVSPGEILLIEPGVTHTFRSSETICTSRIAGIHLELVAEGSWAAGDYRLAQTPDRITQPHNIGYLQSRFERLAIIFAGYDPYRQFLLNTIAHEVVLLLMSEWRRSVPAQVSLRMQEMI